MYGCINIYGKNAFFGTFFGCLYTKSVPKYSQQHLQLDSMPFFPQASWTCVQTKFLKLNFFFSCCSCWISTGFPSVQEFLRKHCHNGKFLPSSSQKSWRKISLWVLHSNVLAFFSVIFEDSQYNHSDLGITGKISSACRTLYKWYQVLVKCDECQWAKLQRKCYIKII